MPRYNLKRVWNAIRPKQEVIPWNHLIWDGWQIPSASVICWLVLKDRIAVKEKLASWMITIDISCVLCSQGIHSGGHLFFCCNYTKDIIKALLRELIVYEDWDDNVAAGCRLWKGKSKLHQAKCLIWCLVVSMFGRSAVKGCLNVSILNLLT